MPESILWLISKACWQTIKCLVYQCVPNTSMSRQFVSMHLIILQMIQVLPSRTGDHPSKSFETLYNCSVLLFANSQHISTHFRHVLPCRRTTRLCLREISQKLVIVSGNSKNTWFKHICKFLNSDFIRFAFTLNTAQIFVFKKWCEVMKINAFHEFLPRGSQKLFSQPCWCHPRKPTRTILVFDEQKSLPNSVLFTIQVHNNPANGCPCKFRSRSTLDLQCLPMIWAMCVVEDVSIRLDILTQEFWAIWERPRVLPSWENADTASTACPSQAGNLATTFITFAAVIWDADEPQGARLCLYTFVIWVVTLQFWGDTYFLFVSLCFENNHLLALDFLQLPCWDCFELLPFLIHCCFCFRNFHRLRHRNNFMNQVVVGHRSISFTCNVILMVLDCEDAARCLVDSWDSTMQSYMVSKSFSLPIFGFAFAFALLGCLFHGIAGAISLSDFLLGMLGISEYSLSCGSMKQIPLSPRALPNFGFSFDHSCFSRFWAAFYQFSSKLLDMHDLVW